mmetsp:Transcript_13889/g.27424  ORF Transcript_13889/g.27424 Transcript_13889/m.27424 type:complete len:202 (+) Transcript_13889:227-832(+)
MASSPPRTEVAPFFPSFFCLGGPSVGPSLAQRAQWQHTWRGSSGQTGRTSCNLMRLSARKENFVLAAATARLSSQAISRRATCRKPRGSLQVSMRPRLQPHPSSAVRLSRRTPATSCTSPGPSALPWRPCPAGRATSLDRRESGLESEARGEVPRPRRHGQRGAAAGPRAAVPLGGLGSFDGRLAVQATGLAGAVSTNAKR